MLENYERNRKQLFFMNSIKLLVFALAIQLIAYTVPAFVTMAEERTAQLQQTLQPVRVIANSSHKQDIAQKNELAAQYEKHKLISTAAIYNIRQGDHVLPPRIIDNRFYPQNVYYGTVITIGAGRGENWFCAMFKQTCMPPKQYESKKISFPYLKKLVSYFW